MTGTCSPRHRYAVVTRPVALPISIFPVPLTIDASLPWSIPHVQRRDPWNIDWLAVTRHDPRSVRPGRSFMPKGWKVYAWTVQHRKGWSTIVGMRTFNGRHDFNCSSRICRVSRERVFGSILMFCSGLIHDCGIEDARVNRAADWKLYEGNPESCTQVLEVLSMWIEC